jgi:hypothetical protein
MSQHTSLGMRRGDKSIFSHAPHKIATPEHRTRPCSGVVVVGKDEATTVAGSDARRRPTATFRRGSAYCGAHLGHSRSSLRHPHRDGRGSWTDVRRLVFCRACRPDLSHGATETGSASPRLAARLHRPLARAHVSNAGRAKKAACLGRFVVLTGIAGLPDPQRTLTAPPG